MRSSTCMTLTAHVHLAVAACLHICQDGATGCQYPWQSHSLRTTTAASIITHSFMALSQEAEDLRHSAKDDTVRSGHAGTGSITAHVLETAPCFVLLDFRYCRVPMAVTQSASQDRLQAKSASCAEMLGKAGVEKIWTSAPVHCRAVLRRDVLGLDATAAQTLGSLWGSLRGASVELVLTGVRRVSMLRLLQACLRCWARQQSSVPPLQAQRLRHADALGCNGGLFPCTSAVVWVDIKPRMCACEIGCVSRALSWHVIATGSWGGDREADRWSEGRGSRQLLQRSRNAVSAFRQHPTGDAVL